MPSDTGYFCILYHRTRNHPADIDPLFFDTINIFTYCLVYTSQTCKYIRRKLFYHMLSAQRQLNEWRQKSLAALLSLGAGQKSLPTSPNFPVEKPAEKAATNVRGFHGTFI